MPKDTNKTFTLQTIFDALGSDDLDNARRRLASAVGSSLSISGKVLKIVKRDEQLKLFIETETNERKFNIFADCLNDAANVKAAKVRKGSAVSIVGNFQTFGTQAACLSDCKLIEKV